MTYVVVDPFLLCYPRDGKPSSEAAKAYLFDLFKWSRTVDRVSVEWRISEACKCEIERLYGSLWQMKSELQKLLEQSGLACDQVTLEKALRHFFETLLVDPFIDLEVDKTRIGDVMLWDVLPDGVKVEPTDHISRLTDEKLQRAYKQTLGDITFAHKNKVFPIAALRQIFIASRKNSAKTENPAQLRVTARCEIFVDENVKSAERLNRQKSVEGNYLIVYSLEELVNIVGKPKTFKSVFDAVSAAVETYPDVLVFPTKAQGTAQKSSFEDLNEVFEIVSGLVKVWLPAYRRGGNDMAKTEFYKEFSRQYSPYESSTVENDSEMKKDRTVKFEGDAIYCSKHIRLGAGSTCFRVNFELVDTEDGPKIVLARAGTHGRNTKTN